MSLSLNNKLQLLHDLLSLHAEECHGSTSECEQITRIIQSIQHDPQIKETGLIQHLDMMKQYSVHGAAAANLEQHISQYQPEMEEWLQAIRDSNV